MNYHRNATQTYGEACEWIGCGWHETVCDVHHIDYNAQWAAEQSIRKAFDEKRVGDYVAFLTAAKQLGYATFNVKDRQLAKNDSVSNLSVLCPNHHRFVHQADMGTGILQFIPPRRQDETP